METTSIEVSKHRFAALKKRRDDLWADTVARSRWARFILENDYDLRFYGVYLIETYHYVLHNPKHQALVGVTSKEPLFRYIKFCYEHAEEETGHEMMAMHDLLSLGLEKDQFTLPEPLSATEVFIGYLYWISTNGNHLRRLGYSFWAEDSYQYIAPLLSKVKDSLELEEHQMTFLVSHATIDEKHSAEIDEMIQEFCKTDADWECVEKVLETSLRLQSHMLDCVVDEYCKLRDGKDTPYSFLNLLRSHAHQVLQ
jgi:hypothetical protein